MKISVTSQALLGNIHGWQKAIKTKEMTENLHTSIYGRFTYMPEKVRIQGELFKFKGNPSFDTC